MVIRRSWSSGSGGQKTRISEEPGAEEGNAWKKDVCKNISRTVLWKKWRGKSRRTEALTKTIQPRCARLSEGCKEKGRARRIQNKPCMSRKDGKVADATQNGGEGERLDECAGPREEKTKNTRVEK